MGYDDGCFGEDLQDQKPKPVEKPPQFSLGVLILIVLALGGTMFGVIRQYQVSREIDRANKAELHVQDLQLSVMLLKASYKCQETEIANLKNQMDKQEKVNHSGF